MTDDRLRRLELENEVMRYEIEALRRRLDGHGDAELTDGVAVDPHELEVLRRARKDLRWLLRRLGTGPFGWVMRRFPGYRALADRHLDLKRRS